MAVSLSDQLLINLRRRSATALDANIGVGLEDPHRAIRKLAARGLVAERVTKRGPVLHGNQKVWAITPSGRSYAAECLRG